MHEDVPLSYASGISEIKIHTTRRSDHKVLSLASWFICARSGVPVVLVARAISNEKRTRFIKIQLFSLRKSLKVAGRVPITIWIHLKFYNKFSLASNVHIITPSYSGENFEDWIQIDINKDTDNSPFISLQTLFNVLCYCIFIGIKLEEKTSNKKVRKADHLKMRKVIFRWKQCDSWFQVPPNNLNKSSRNSGSNTKF